MYDSYVADQLDNISKESLQPLCLYQSSDIDKLRSKVNRLENDITTLMVENTR